MHPRAKTILWTAAAWGPVVVVGLNLAVLWGLIAKGGLGKAVAWALLQIMPILGVPLVLGALVALAVRRTVSPAIVSSLLIGLAASIQLGGLLGQPTWMLAYPASLETTEPAATVRLPTDEPMVVGWGGDDAAVNYHVIDAAQRWAYDLLVEPAAHGGKELEGFGCWGVPVLAPASGTITVAEDGHQDHAPGDVGDLNAAGNHVAIRLDETDTHLVLAHLRQGSVAVEVGQEVTEGDVLGRCGNSGNTSEPHVHIHHQRQDPAELGLLAEGLPLYFRDHGGPPMPEGGLEVEGETVRMIGARVRHQPAPSP